MKHNAPYDLCHTPVHRLNTPQTKAWMMGGEIRRKMASQLAKRYPSGVGVLERGQCLIAYVLPNGSVRELPPPFRRFEMYQIANQPGLAECPCAGFFDPESGGPWRERGDARHHPLCQFEPVAAAAYQDLLDQQKGGKPANQRPDSWEQARKKYQGK